MTKEVHPELGLSTATGRWSALGPYYAMFPTEFAFDVVTEHSLAGESVLDPFAGRGSSVYAAAVLGRSALGFEINPVGWLYGHVKLRPAGQARVLARIRLLGDLASQADSALLEGLPPFFSACYAPEVLRYLTVARNALRWKDSIVDATVMAVILVYLHGKLGSALSNQLRQGKSMSPEYCVQWWKAHDLSPPELDTVEFLIQRAKWRYAKGAPSLSIGKVRLGDSTKLLPQLARHSPPERRFSLLFTSPPYYAITNYHYDQWLRLWMLGGPAHPHKSGGVWQGKFESRAAYQSLLRQVFQASSNVLQETATIYVRTDARKFTYETTLTVLREVFPTKTVTTVERPFTRDTQTALFGDKSKKPGEIDIILRS
jgi:hypothetical protein